MGGKYFNSIAGMLIVIVWPIVDAWLLLCWSVVAYSIVAIVWWQVGEKFRNRSLKFPGLISGCTMDWFSRWPKDALIAVSSHFLGQYNIVGEDDTKRQLIEMMGSVHDGVAENCTTYFQRWLEPFLCFSDGKARSLANCGSGIVPYDVTTVP